MHARKLMPWHDIVRSGFVIIVKLLLELDPFLLLLWSTAIYLQVTVYIPIAKDSEVITFNLRFCVQAIISNTYHTILTVYNLKFILNDSIEV